MRLQHAHTLARARTYVAALADDASSAEASSGYEHVLIELDRLHDDHSPDINPEPLPADRSLRFEVATTAVEDLCRWGLDPLSVELVLCLLHDAYTRDRRDDLDNDHDRPDHDRPGYDSPGRDSAGSGSSHDGDGHSTDGGGG